MATGVVVSVGATQEADAGGPRAPTPQLERGRAVYVLSACHFCHGVDLTQAQMGATDLMRSPLIAADQNGNLIGAVVRAGKPNLQTAMPAYPDMTAQEVADLAAYIHYLRQAGRYRALITALLAEGNASAGEVYFAANCTSCHSRSRDLAAIGARLPLAALRERLLRPAATPSPSASDAVTVGQRQHLRLLERYTEADIRNLLAFLQRP